MKIACLNLFYNLPLEGLPPQRYWLLPQALVRAGHDVTLWTSSFSHATKKPRVLLESPESCAAREGIHVRLIPSLAYARNISLRRVWSHLRTAHTWLHLMKQETPPDCLVVSIPPLSLGRAAQRYAHAHGIPFIVDIQDAWPETFERILPRPVLAPLRGQARQIYCGATALTAVASRYLELARASGATCPMQVFYPAVEAHPTAPPRSSSTLKLVYIGNMSLTYDLRTVIEGVLQTDDVELDLAGTGPDEPALRRLAAGSKRIRFHGYLADAPLHALLANASVGLIPMRANSCVGVPAKLAEYVQVPLPLLNALEGETAQLIASYHAGLTYTVDHVPSFIAALTRLKQTPLDEFRLGAQSLAPLFNARTVYDTMAQWIKTVCLKA